MVRSIDTLIRAELVAALAFFEGDKICAAHALGVHLKTVYNWIDKYQIDCIEWASPPPTLVASVVVAALGVST